MREEILRELEGEFARRRAAHEEEESLRKQKIRGTIPELKALTEEREEMIFGSIRGILAGKAAAEDLPQRMEALNARIREELKKNGYPEDYLAPIYDCGKCRDTGYTGEPVKEMCECMQKAYQERLREEIGLQGGGTETFENYDESLFSNEKVPGKKYSQREISEMARFFCEDWAGKWPEQTPRDVLISGKSGLGKTFFLHAMAAKLLEKGANVILISAYDFLETARAGYFGRESNMEELMSAEVLMLDDLGSEPMMKNITVELLFNLINERQRRNLATVISTNLDMQELRERYTERIASRLSDRRVCGLVTLYGKDIRTGRG